MYKCILLWKERLPEILRGYAKEDIYNLDETRCSWKAPPYQVWSEGEEVQWEEV